MNMKRSITSMVIAGAVAASLASPAHAAGQDGAIDNNEFIFFYNSSQAGSISDFATNKADLAGYTFLKSGLSGYGQAVKNNSASVRNLRASVARVYFSSNYVGVYDEVAAESSRNLANTYNENASFRWQ